MTHIHHTNRYFALGLMLALLSGIMLLGFAQSAQAAREERRDERAVSGHREFRDSRYHHDRVYPARGQVIRALPRDHRVVVHGGHDTISPEASGTARRGRASPSLRPRSVFSSPSCPRITQRYGSAAGPTTMPTKSIMHTGETAMSLSSRRRATSVRRRRRPTRCSSIPAKTKANSNRRTDRYECHRWAVSQTGFDPTQPPGGVPEDQMGQKRADYQRAMGACLDGRGYTVK